MITPLALIESLRIGSVDFVSPNEIKATLDIEAPKDVALNAGMPRPFPRINGYVIIPSDVGFVVGQIEWITIENSPYPKRKGIQDFGVIDLPFPLRKMSLNPLGVLHEKSYYTGDESPFIFSRGVEVFPTVGDPVLLPSQIQLKSIIESGENRRVKIGVSPLAANADVSIDPDRLFGRHLAILGNTGSGKSCSVAGMVRWSIEAAKKEKTNDKPVNSRFIILDPNGEYIRAFSDMPNVRIFSVDGDEDNGIKQLHVPLWLWNSAEWCAFTQASVRTQKPTLIQALRTVRDGKLKVATPSASMRRYLRTLLAILKIVYSSGDPWASGRKNFGIRKNFYEGLRKWSSEIKGNESFSDEENEQIDILYEKFDSLISAHKAQYDDLLFSASEIRDLIDEISTTHSIFGGNDSDILPIDADVPRPFTGEDLLRSLEATAEMLGTADHVETMIMRVRTLMSDARMKIVTSYSEDMTLDKWLSDYICPSDPNNSALTIIDLSLVPAEVIHIVTAVIARVILESLQRYRHDNNGSTLPTTIIMEEAHTFIRKYNTDGDENSAYKMCTQVFEKISREGRKFGLGLVLSSQRPSELSPTVLSQCNTFLLHRISNDKDQELVNKLVPDNLRGLLRDLPSLPSQKAILLGWASELPILVQMNYLDEKFRPQSNDPNYWGAWTNDENKLVNWESIAGSWQDYEMDRESNGETDAE